MFCGDENNTYMQEDQSGGVHTKVRWLCLTLLCPGISSLVRWFSGRGFGVRANKQLTDSDVHGCMHVRALPLSGGGNIRDEIKMPSVGRKVRFQPDTTGASA